jgi:hypothetical protein
MGSKNLDKNTKDPWHFVLVKMTKISYLYTMLKIEVIVEEVNDEGDWEHRGNGGEIVLLLEIKDIFSMNVVLSNEKGCEFYVACCKKPIFVDVGVASLNDD